MIDEHPATGMLQNFLVGRDVPCPGCGYNLRGLTTDRCPECNEDLQLQVGLAEPKLASYLTGLIGLAVGSGFFGIVLVWASVLLLAGRGGPSRGDVLLITASAAVELVALTAWLRARPALRRAPGPRRAQLAAGCWALTGLLVVLFVSAVR